MADNGIITKAAEFDNTPEGWQRRWSVEMAASEKFLKDWWKRADKVMDRYVDDRKGAGQAGDTRVNLFTANIQTQRAMLYGKTPSTEVKRRFADPGDDVARVAGEALQRMLNTDIERDSDTYAEALEMALDDRLLAGMGSVRVRYEVETQAGEFVDSIKEVNDDGVEVEVAPGYQKEDTITKEEVEVDYVHWKDERWSPCRNFHENRWRAWKADMTRDALHARFDEVLGTVAVESIPLKHKKATDDDKMRDDPWARAEVWEIWSKEHKKVYWWVEGASTILDVKDDPLGLDGFYPAPRPMMSNLTTSKYLPVPDFTLAQDLYDEVDAVSTRITKLERAIKAVGVYDKTSEELKRLLLEAVDNQMIPVDNFLSFGEKGGLKGAVDWLPLEQFVMALDKLREYRSELIALLYQVTGMSDIMRGQSSGATTATEQAIKAKFASTRMQAFQNEFARFASDVMSLKAEIISKHFDPQTIIARSNMKMMSPQDQQLAQSAVQIIKSDVYQYRVAVKPEAISMQDYAAIKQERGEMLTAVATFLQSSMPVMQAAPPLTPMLLQLLQWAVAGFRGGATIEGAIDQAVVQAQQKLANPPPPQPNPEMMKMQQESQMAQQEHQMNMQALQVKTQTEMAKAKMGLQMQQQKHMMDLTAQHQKTQLELGAQQQSAQLDAQQGQAEHELSMQKQEADIRAAAVKGDIAAKAAKSKAQRTKTQK